MMRIIDIAAKDLLQYMRERNTFLFFLIMPVLLTLLMGYAFGGFGGSDADPRLPVGFLDEDRTWLSREFQSLLITSEVVRLEEGGTRPDLEARVADENLAAAIIIPPGYSHAIMRGKSAKLILIADTTTPVGSTVESEALTMLIRLESAVRTALIMEQVAADRSPFDYTFEQSLSAWQQPPISVQDSTSSKIKKKDNGPISTANTSPGMMLQFAIAGLSVSAQVIVNERKTRCLQRLLTTATARLHILLGHYLAIFALIFSQFLLLIAFGQVILKLDYLAEPVATLLVALAAALCIAALGLLIGTLAKTEEQAIIFSIVPMFILAGLGGAWVPLEVTSPAFQAVGHFSPVAWAMDGFKSIVSRGLGLASVLLPAGVLVGYALLFFGLAAWRFQFSQEN